MKIDGGVSLAVENFIMLKSEAAMDQLSTVEVCELEHHLERTLSTMVYGLIGQYPRTVQCRFLSRHSIVVFISGIRTSPEQLLLEVGSTALAKAFRSSLHTILGDYITRLVEQATGTEVVRLALPKHREGEQLGFIASIKPCEVAAARVT